MSYLVDTEEYAARDSGKLLVDIHQDSARPDAPAVVFLHGGGWRIGDRTSVSPGLDDLRPTIFQRLVSAGFTVVSADYRLSTGAQWPAQLEDVRELAAWMSDTHRPWQGRYAVWGASAGGHLALHLALQSTGEAQPTAAVTWFAPTDLASIPNQARTDAVADPLAHDSREAQLLGVRPVDDPDLARVASPIAYVRADAPPILLQHGNVDRFVPYQQSAQMHAALAAVGAPAELDIVPHADHFWGGIDPVTTVLPRMIDFLHGCDGLCSPRA